HASAHTLVAPVQLTLQGAGGGWVRHLIPEDGVRLRASESRARQTAGARAVAAESRVEQVAGVSAGAGETSGVAAGGAVAGRIRHPQGQPGGKAADGAGA